MGRLPDFDTYIAGRSLDGFIKEVNELKEKGEGLGLRNLIIRMSLDGDNPNVSGTRDMTTEEIAEQDELRNKTNKIRLANQIKTLDVIKKDIERLNLEIKDFTGI